MIVQNKIPVVLLDFFFSYNFVTLINLNILFAGAQN